MRSILFSVLFWLLVTAHICFAEDHGEADRIGEHPPAPVTHYCICYSTSDSHTFGEDSAGEVANYSSQSGRGSCVEQADAVYTYSYRSNGFLFALRGDPGEETLDKPGKYVECQEVGHSSAELSASLDARIEGRKIYARNTCHNYGSFFSQKPGVSGPSQAECLKAAAGASLGYAASFQEAGRNIFYDQCFAEVDRLCKR
jgi:hypothetical protein